MFTVLYVLMVLSALLALVSGVRALGAGLRLRRARKEFQSRVVDDLSLLAARTGELESGLDDLQARAQQLPVKVSRLQRNIVTLRVLAGALGESLRLAQRALSVARLKDAGSARIAALVFPQIEDYASRRLGEKRRGRHG